LDMRRMTFGVSDHNRARSASIPFPHQPTGFGTS
jgi:hypothetical protein